MATAEELLVLKAFYLGHSLRGNLKPLPAIDHAIQHTTGNRQAFYVFLKCEILRLTDQLLDCRAQARELVGPELFALYMKVQSATAGPNNSVRAERGNYMYGYERFPETALDLDHHEYLATSLAKMTLEQLLLAHKLPLPAPEVD